MPFRIGLINRGQIDMTWKKLSNLAKILWSLASLYILYLGINCAVDMSPQNHDCPILFYLLVT